MFSVKRKIFQIKVVALNKLDQPMFSESERNDSFDLDLRKDNSPPRLVYTMIQI